MLLTLMLPVQVTIIPQYAFFTKLNLTNLVEGISTTGMKG
jgi:ABC-type glycerol-3-phosphate transport system permease component